VKCGFDVCDFDFCVFGGLGLFIVCWLIDIFGFWVVFVLCDFGNFSVFGLFVIDLCSDYV